MTDRLIELKKQSCRLARKFGSLGFYSDFAEEAAVSSEMFFNDWTLRKLQQDSVAFLYDDFMFGIEHSKRLAMDACTLVLARDPGANKADSRRLGLLAQIAAMIRDMECAGGESDRDHGSASGLLEGCDLSAEEQRLVAGASTCRRRPGPDEDERMAILGDCLHDAYWFRFGPDIFSTVMWIYCDYATLPLDQLVGQFETGVEDARYASDGFLTEPGKNYGPEILQAGVEQGETMLELLRKAAREDKLR